MRPRVQPEGTSELQRAAKAFRKGERALHEAIFRAHRAGSSLRVIAVETGLSHESVRVIVQRVGEWAEKERVNLKGDGYSTTVEASRRSEASRRRRREHLDWLVGVRDSDE